MTALLLDPTSFLALLIAGAVVTPLVGFAVVRWVPGWRRTGMVAGAFGPFALAFWGIHQMVLKTVGFDSIWSVVIVLTSCAVVGWLAGRWAAGETTSVGLAPKNTPVEEGKNS